MIAIHHNPSQSQSIIPQANLAPVRVILSRKGFDSVSGGGPSPVLPDGRMLSLPIPTDADETVRYADIPSPWGQGSLLELLQQLGYPEHSHAHLDPDLVASHCRRAQGWKGLFGQVRAAATH